MSRSLSLDMPLASGALPSQSSERPVSAATPRRLRSEDLFAGHDTLVLIEHHGAVYRLHKTRLGKLILNK